MATALIIVFNNYVTIFCSHFQQERSHYHNGGPIDNIHRGAKEDLPSPFTCSQKEVRIQQYHIKILQCSTHSNS